MNILLHHKTKPVLQASNAGFTGDRLCIGQSAGRELTVTDKKVPGLKWVARAMPKQRAAWPVEPGGDAIYWEQLDDGVESGYLRNLESLN